MSIVLLSKSWIGSSTEEADPVGFFRIVSEVFGQAEKVAGGPVDRFYCIGGFNIRLRFAGDALIPYITPALEHLAIEPVVDPALTIRLWDSASTHIPMPRPPWGKEAYQVRGEIRGFIHGHVHTIFELGTNALSLLDADQNLAIYWVRTPRQIPYYDTGAPLRPILHLWMGKRGLQFVHGGAVGLPRGGVLLVGKGNCGKSNTALACLQSDLFYASDDYCLVSVAPVPTVFSVYSTGKTNSEDIERFPFLSQAIGNPYRLDTEKALFFLKRHFPEKLLPRFPLRAILVPRITGKPETTWKTASPASGLLAVVPSTIQQLPYAGGDVLERMAKIAESVPSYHLELGTDLTQIPRVILEILDRNA